MTAMFFMLITGFGWILGAILFEALFGWLRKKGTTWFSKANGCRAWWVLMGLFSTMSGPVPFLVGLPVLLAIGLTHIYVADRKRDDEIITLAEIFKNMGPALSLAASKIKPFLK